MNIMTVHYGNNCSGNASNAYRCGRLRVTKPPICHQNSAAKPIKNSAPAHSPVETRARSSPAIAIGDQRQHGDGGG